MFVENSIVQVTQFRLPHWRGGINRIVVSAISLLSFRRVGSLMVGATNRNGGSSLLISPEGRAILGGTSRLEPVL